MQNKASHGDKTIVLPQAPLRLPAREPLADNLAVSTSTAEPPGKDRWYAKGLRFTCQQCHRCCRASQPGWVYARPQEIRRIAKHLELSPETFRRRYLRRDPSGETVLQVSKNGDCIFWKDGCSIYAVRPRQCRTFPFWSENLDEPQSWEELTRQCAGAGSGKLYRLEEINSVLHGRATGTQEST